MTWYQRLKFARKVSWLTLRQVSKRSGLSNPYISQLENGKVSDPGFFTIMVLLRVYNLKPENLL